MTSLTADWRRDNAIVGYPRVVVHGVSPLIWRRLLVRAETTIAGLHAVMQAAFGWDGEHLHRFVIHGVEYGIGYVGGVGFRDDPHLVRLRGPCLADPVRGTTADADRPSVHPSESNRR